MDIAGAKGTLKQSFYSRSLGTSGTGLSFPGILFHPVMNSESLTQIVEISSETRVICMALGHDISASSTTFSFIWLYQCCNSSLGSHNGGPGQRSLPVWCSMTPWKVAASVRHPTPSLIIPLLDHLTQDTSPSALPSEKEGERLGFVPREKHTKDLEKHTTWKLQGLWVRWHRRPTHSINNRES